MKSVRFNNAGTFAASRAAEHWLRQRGFSFGPSQVGGPQAVWHGDCWISKWRNLSRKERMEVHAVLEGDVREGPMTITIRPGATVEAIAAFNLTDAQVANKLALTETPTQEAKP